MVQLFGPPYILLTKGNYLSLFVVSSVIDQGLIKTPHLITFPLLKTFVISSCSLEYETLGKILLY